VVASGLMPADERTVLIHRWVGKQLHEVAQPDAPSARCGLSFLGAPTHADQGVLIDPTYVPPQLPAQWPEGYWNVTSGISGNIVS
jgi:hypothetical protein